MPAPSRRHVDVALVSDFRFPGGTSSSLATEIRAQAAAGYRTALVQVPAPLLTTARPFNDKIRACLEEGLAELVLPDEPLDADLLLVRHPGVLSRMPVVRPDVRAGRRLMVVNQVPSDGSQPTPFYSIPDVERHAHEIFGPGFVWAPIGPLVREALIADPHDVQLSAGDWSNVLRTEEWASDRTGFCADRPVIGRHSRPHWRKWPETRADLLAAYPDDPAYLVRVMGGADAPARVLGGVPSNWEVLEFNAEPVPAFLATIDFFVYFHHSGLVEAFGRAVIEAIAAGAVAILPPHFAGLFADACRYGAPQDVRGIVDELYSDPAAYRAQAERGQAYVRRHFSWGAHVERLEDLIGARTAQSSRVEQVVPSRARILLITGGTDTRSAVARVREASSQLADCNTMLVCAQGAEPADSGVDVVQRLPREPSRRRRGWRKAATRRLDHLVQTYRPTAIVVDIASDPPALPPAPGVPVLWLGPTPQERRIDAGSVLDPEAPDLGGRVLASLQAAGASGAGR